MQDYNFFEHYNKRNRIEIDPKSPAFIGLVLIGICAAACAALVYSNAGLSAQVSALQQQVQSGKGQEAYIEANRLQRRIDAMGQYDQMAGGLLQLFKAADVLDAETLQTLTAALPQAVTLNSAVIDRSTASLEFAGPDRRAAAELLLNLKDCGLFDSVELSAVANDPNSGTVSVTVTAQMKAGEQR